MLLIFLRNCVDQWFSTFLGGDTNYEYEKWATHLIIKTQMPHYMYLKLKFKVWKCLATLEKKLATHKCVVLRTTDVDIYRSLYWFYTALWFFIILLTWTMLCSFIWFWLEHLALRCSLVEGKKKKNLEGWRRRLISHLGIENPC